MSPATTGSLPATNNLLLEGPAYQEYLGGLGAYRHSEHDGRTWINNNLFSRLTTTQYLHGLAEAGFRRRFVSAIVDLRAVAYLKHSQSAGRLLERFDRLDLLVSGMTIVYER